MANRIDREAPITSDNSDLDKCPFCDSDPVLCRKVKLTYSGIKKEHAIDFYWVMCPFCKSRGRDFENVNDAIWSWNLRKYTEMEVKRYAKEIRTAVYSGRSYRFKRKKEIRKNSN